MGGRPTSLFVSTPNICVWTFLDSNEARLQMHSSDDQLRFEECLWLVCTTLEISALMWPMRTTRNFFCYNKCFDVADEGDKELFFCYKASG